MDAAKSFYAARQAIRDFRPDVVIGAGGYVTGSVLLMAALMRIRTLVMESNAVPGFTNRMLARFVDRAAVSFEAALKFFYGKGVLTGNPIRREFFDIPPKARDDARFSLLIFGGSQGARAINEAMVAALPGLEPHKSVLRITHQTGELDYEKVRDGYKSADWESQAEVTKYIDEMVAAFTSADLVVSRAGATTAAELIAARRAALMVPLPGQIEQQRNAETLQDAGAARMILQANLSGASLASEIATLVAHPERVTQMEQECSKLSRGDAAAATVDLIEEMVGGKR
ncbi:MAG: UDP-N-acetylglucosamine--N-acetylmuramyl-(pentapeptide) pyrophosphoryl-undecaprenol N-acetylglucosamine transferase [Pyrinomonadaceae bacterium]